MTLKVEFRTRWTCQQFFNACFSKMFWAQPEQGFSSRRLQGALCGRRPWTAPRRKEQLHEACRETAERMATGDVLRAGRAPRRGGMSLKICSHGPLSPGQGQPEGLWATHNKAEEQRQTRKKLWKEIIRHMAFLLCLSPHRRNSDGLSTDIKKQEIRVGRQGGEVLCLKLNLRKRNC